MNKLEKFGYKKLSKTLYEGKNGYIIYNEDNVIIKDKVFEFEFLNALITSRPKSYAGRKAMPIPDDFDKSVLDGLTYPQLMEKYNVARRTIAKWKRMI